MSMPRATPAQMGNATEIVMRATGSNPSVLLLMGGLDLIRNEFPEVDTGRGKVEPKTAEKMIELLIKQLKHVKKLRSEGKIPMTTIMVAPQG